MKKKMTNILDRIFKKPLYRVFLFLLGLPTFLVSFIVYCARKSSYAKTDKTSEIRARILAELEKKRRKTGLVQ